MTLDYGAHLLFLLGLVLVGVLVWTPRGTDFKFSCFAAFVLVLGIFAANSAFHTRGSVWLREPMRHFSYELKSSKSNALGKHHLILAPTEVERLPELFDEQGGPISLALAFQLQPDGSVSQVNVQDPSGNPILDSATASTVRSWKFGPIPPNYSPRRAETVSLRIENRYEFLRQNRAMMLSLGIFILSWLGSVALLPIRVSDDETAQGLVRRMLTGAGFLAGLGWILIWRLAPDFNRFDLPGKQLGMMVGSFALVWLVALVASRPSFSRFLIAQSTHFVWLGVGLLLLTRFFGTDLNTGHRLWLSTPIGPFQTVELVKLLLIFFVAGSAYAAANSAPIEGSRNYQISRIRPWKERYRGLIGGFVIVFGALLLMSDFGPLLLLALLLLALLWGQGFPRQALIGFSLLLVLLTSSYAVGFPARWHDRVAMWRNPWVTLPSDSGQLAEGRENISRVLWSISTGGLTGLGIGQGNPDDIEAVESDFIYSAIAEELGWLGGAAVLSLILVLAVSGLQLANKRDDALAKTLASGLGMLMAIQAALTIGGNLGLWPLTGITLPFLSYGRSSLLVSFLALGLLIAQAPRQDKRALEKPLPQSEPVRFAHHYIQLAMCLLFVVLVGRAAWLQWPVIRNRVMTHQHERADGSFLSNPRLDGRDRVVSTHIVRGSILDRNGEPLVKTTPRGRVYEDGPVFASLVGLQERGQRVGIERSLQGPLMGQWDAPDGRFLLPHLVGERRGFDVKLTLDKHLQERAYQLLESKGYRGCIVGIEPSTGHVLFAASNPAPQNLAQWMAGYDSNTSKAPPFPYRKVYDPGSTFKTFTAAAALEKDVVRPNETFLCRDGYFPPGGGEINDEYGASHGRISLSRALAVSCNQTYAQIGVRLGWQRFWDFTTRAGLNTSWPLLPSQWKPPSSHAWLSSASGQLTNHNAKPDEWKADAALARSAIGQENVRATPLYLATWTAAIANNGLLMPPSLVSSVSDQSGRTLADAPQTQPIEIMSERTARHLTDMMERVVTQGTGKPGQLDGIRIAAKTGTPQVGTRLQANNALYIAFAPVEKPRIAIAVVIEGRSGGGATGGPLAADMIREVCNQTQN